jgi:hypothetical protein
MNFLTFWGKYVIDNYVWFGWDIMGGGGGELQLTRGELVFVKAGLHYQILGFEGFVRNWLFNESVPSNISYKSFKT